MDVPPVAGEESMSQHGLEHACPSCASHHVVSMTLPVPRHSEPDAKPTRRAHRCLDCATQWPPGTVTELESDVAQPDGTTTSLAR